MTVIDLQTMRYINLLDRISRVKTSKCFSYNNTIMFFVPENFVAQAIGINAENVRRMQEMLGKKVRIVKEAKSNSDLERFIHDIVSPVGFKGIEVKGEEVILNAGSQSKAALIGRNRRRLLELARIIKDNFGLELKIL